MKAYHLQKKIIALLVFLITVGNGYTQSLGNIIGFDPVQVNMPGSLGIHHVSINAPGGYEIYELFMFLDSGGETYDNWGGGIRVVPSTW